MLKKILIITLVVLVGNTCFSANTKTSCKSKTKLTPKEKEVRKQMFNNAVNNGMNRAKAYNIYY